jgi:hypothetical protein
MEYYSQTSLDEYYTLDEHREEEETVEESDTKPCKCNYCILKEMKKYIFHPGSIFLYFKDGELRVLGDIDHVYHKCRESLIDNIGFLYRMMCELKSTGYNVVVVRKAFDDDLYVYVVDRVGEGKIVYNGLHVMVGGLNSIEGFERMNWYMQTIDDETVIEVAETVKKYMVMA